MLRAPLTDWCQVLEGTPSATDCKKASTCVGVIASRSRRRCPPGLDATRERFFARSALHPVHRGRWPCHIGQQHQRTAWRCGAARDDGGRRKSCPRLMVSLAKPGGQVILLHGLCQKLTSQALSKPPRFALDLIDRVGLMVLDISEPFQDPCYTGVLGQAA